VRSAWLALAVLFLWSPAQQKFRSGTEAVRVDVLVMNGRTPVPGLTAANFELRDSGVTQQIETASLEDVPLSLMLALDTSQSVKGEALANLKDAAIAAVRQLQATDRAALLTFTGAVRLRTPWTSDRVALENGIRATEADGSTTLHDATYAALTLRDPQPGGRPLVLIFSDGVDTASWLPGRNVIDIARRNDAVVYAVTLGQPRVIVGNAGGSPFSSDATTIEPMSGYRLDFRSGIQEPVENAPVAMLLEPFVEALADETGGKVLNAERSDQLRETFVQVMNEFRSRYLLTYTPKGVDATGWHPIEVRLKGARGKVTARRGYVR
jgi:VWFA-related protein